MQLKERARVSCAASDERTKEEKIQRETYLVNSLSVYLPDFPSRWVVASPHKLDPFPRKMIDIIEALKNYFLTLKEIKSII